MSKEKDDIIYLTAIGVSYKNKTKTMFLYSVRTMTLLPTQAKGPVLALVAKDLQANVPLDLKKRYKIS